MKTAQEYLASGASIAVVPAFTLVDYATKARFGTAWDFGLPPGNVAVKHRDLFAITVTVPGFYQSAEEYGPFIALRELGGGTLTIGLGRSTTRVFRLTGDQKVTTGPIKSGALLGAKIEDYFHIPPTSIFENGIVAAEFVVESPPTYLPDALQNELVRVGMLRVWSAA